jgi:hypothetical protein
MVLSKTKEGGVTKVIPPSKNPAHHNYMMGSPNDPNEEESPLFDNLFPNTLDTDSNSVNTDLLIIIKPLVQPSQAAGQPFDPDGSIPPNFQFQIDLLDTDLKLHNQIVSVIKNHSYLDRLNFSSDDLQIRLSLLHKIESNLGTSRFRSKDIVVDLTFGEKAIVHICL